MRISDWSSDVCSSDLPSIPRSCPLHYRLRLWRPHRYPASLQPRSPRQCLGAQAAWQSSRVLPPLTAPAANLVAVGQIHGAGYWTEIVPIKQNDYLSVHIEGLDIHFK